MSGSNVPAGSLVLYKSAPAIVRQAAEKLEIELDGGRTLKVREKDVVLLHPGPLRSLAELDEPSGDIETAWEILASGETVTLQDVAELAFGAATPAAVWAAWRVVAEGLYFRGTPSAVEARSRQEIERERARREARSALKSARSAFFERLRAGRIAPEDEPFIIEVEELALGRRGESMVLRELGRAESPGNAHALLLSVGRWSRFVDPHPARSGVALASPELELGGLEEEERLDLTGLQAFAIDDEGSKDPDDALSMDGDRLWVHVADVAALVRPGSPADLEARARGANLYLPEGTVHMLPPGATRTLGLGLASLSPALSFGLDLDASGEIRGIEIVRSRVRVERLSYEEAGLRLEEPPFSRLRAVARAAEERRRRRGAVFLEFPEVKIEVVEGEVRLRPLLPLESRKIVQEAMLLAGEAAGRFAVERGIPLPFTTQEPPDEGGPAEGLAAMFALRRLLKRGQPRSVPAPHAGLGLEVYVQATSPLRRYLDLVAHQQLRAHLRGEPLLSVEELIERVGAADALSAAVRQAERLARRHWTLVYLLDHPDWSGEGIVVEKRGPMATLLAPALDLETRARLREDLPLDSAVRLSRPQVDLPELEVMFRIET
jgi:exoribonuclease-2